MEYGRLVVLGYSSYRVDTVELRPRSGSVECAPSSFGLSEEGDRSVTSVSSSSSSASSKRALGQTWKPLGDQNAEFVLQKRSRPNGVELRRFHHVRSIEELKESKHQAGTNNLKQSKHRANETVTKDLKGITTRIMQRIERTRSRLSVVDNQREDSPPVVAPYQMCVPMNDKDPFVCVTEFHADASTDMFQIGRMPCRQNDFVIPGPRVGSSGTISRYAARIVCSREPPYECRIYAGGFDAARRMSTAGHALKHCSHCGKWSKRFATNHTCVMRTMLEQSRDGGGNRGAFSRVKQSSNNLLRGEVQHYIDETKEDGLLEHFEVDLRDGNELPLDGLTKNGVRVWLPECKQWFEVSVNGRLFAIESRTVVEKSTPSTSSRSKALRSSAFNRPAGNAEGFAPILADGAIIDLGGVQLQFQTNHRSGLEGEAENNELLEAPVVYGRATLSSVSTQLERLNVQCPVQLHSLRFTRAAPGEDVPLDQIPHVFTACGHVFGYEERIAKSHTCPLCRTPGSLVRLLLKENSQLQSAEEQHAIPECVFNPCGHAISTKLAQHYSALRMPNGRAICPFCAVHLDLRVPFSRLYLYCDSD